MQAVDHPDYWENRYQQGTTRWDIGQAAPALISLLNSPQSPAPGRAIVLGCGRGYDALLFANKGFQVIGVDFAAAAVAAATALARSIASLAQFIQRDIFELLPEYANQFDYVIEHTCFCAIAPEQRPAYVQLAYGLLRPQGEVLGVFFTHSRPGGPPFGTSPQEIRYHFAPYFDLVALSPVPNSVPERQGEEHWGRFRRRERVTVGD